MMTIEEIFLVYTKKQFEQYKALAEKAIAQIDDEKIFFRANEDCNSIAMIIQHMSGNMLSRWTDFLTTDGEKEWRKREEEFEIILLTKEAVMRDWEAGWKCFFDTFNSLKPEQLQNTIFIRKEPLTVLQAINRQLAHYPYHVGQIVLIAKMLKINGWESLSIAKKQ